MTITRVGFIGLGNMGSPMAAHLADAGFAMTVSDAAPGVTEGFVAAHPTSIAAAGARSFATADALILMLPTSEIVEDVLEGDKVADALPPGCLVIDMSSSEPLRTRRQAARLQARGLSMLDAPVSGGVRGARAARLSVLVGGSQQGVRTGLPQAVEGGRARLTDRVVGRLLAPAPAVQHGQHHRTTLLHAVFLAARLVGGAFHRRLVRD